MGICDGRVVDRDRRGSRPRARALARRSRPKAPRSWSTTSARRCRATPPTSRRAPRWSARSGPPAARRSSTATTSATGTAPVGWWRRRSTRSAALDTVVCNAGIVRDRMIVNMSVDEWDAVIRVHLRGMFCPVRHAIGYWRDEQQGRPRSGRAHRHDDVGRRAARLDRAGQLRRGQGRDRRVHHQRGRRARSLRRRRQHHRAVGAQPDDRGRDAGDDGATGSGLRRHGPRQRVTVRRVAGQRATAT